METLIEPSREIGIQVECDVLVVGRCLSSDFGVQEVLRVIPPCMATGQAAGTAAALAVEQGITPRELHPTTLRGKLVEHGVVLGV